MLVPKSTRMHQFIVLHKFYVARSQSPLPYPLIQAFVPKIVEPLFQRTKTFPLMCFTENLMLLDFAMIIEVQNIFNFIPDNHK